MYIIKEVSETMTTEEYLKKKEQDELDRLFDEAINEAKQKELSQLAKKEKEEYFISLITKLSDCEDELAILEEQLSQYIKNPDVMKDKIDNIKRDIKVMKIKYTKTKNEIDRFIREEKENENSQFNTNIK